MSFEYEEVKYRSKADSDTLSKNDARIRLPDGRIVQVQSWLESDPPVPQFITLYQGTESDTTAELVSE